MKEVSYCKYLGITINAENARSLEILELTTARNPALSGISKFRELKKMTVKDNFPTQGLFKPTSRLEAVYIFRFLLCKSCAIMFKYTSFTTPLEQLEVLRMSLHIS